MYITYTARTFLRLDIKSWLDPYSNQILPGVNQRLESDQK